MKIEKLKNNESNFIEGPFLIKPQIFEDERGFFYESWNQIKFDEITNEKIFFLQDNVSRSKKGVLRGLHFQCNPNAQGKLVRCPIGEIFDVAVDLRLNSKTFGKYVSAYLTETNKNQLWIPKGFAHGFLTLSENAEVNYKASGFWSKNDERSLSWVDEDINIKWPLDKIDKEEPILNYKDKIANKLSHYIKEGDLF